MPAPSVTVLLVEDHLILRQVLKAALVQEPGITVVAEAGDGRQAVKLAEKYQPDVIVMDIAMPGLNGMEAMRQILQILPLTRILILSGYTDEALVEQAAELGAAGYFPKQSTQASVLAAAIRNIPRMGKWTPHNTPRHAPAKTRILSSREVEVLQLIAEGKTNKATADALFLSTKTVEKHRQSLMDKLHIHETASLTRYAIAHGIIHVSRNDGILAGQSSK